VIDLEAREAIAFGLRPDPVTTWKPSGFELKHWREIAGNEPLIGPSSRFVDTKIYPEWSGVGEHYDYVIMAAQEERDFRYNTKYVENKTESDA
jgi:hypothetical protein